MSLILEALRKPEAERRRRSAHDVALELPPAAVERARSVPAWLLPALVAIAIAILVAIWWSQRGPATPATTAPPATVETPAPAVAPTVAPRPQPQVAAPPTVATVAPQVSPPPSPTPPAPAAP